MIGALLTMAVLPSATAGVLVIADDGALAPLGAIVEHDVYELLARDASTLVAPRQRDDAAAVDAARATAETALEDGRAAYYELEAERAKQALKRATDAYLSIADVALHADAAAALALRASVLLDLDDEDAAVAVVEELLFLDDSGAWVGAEGVSEATVELAATVRRRIDATPAGVVTFTSASVPLLVWLDGKLVGATPLTVDAKPGAHSYVLARAGFERRAGHVRVVAGKEKAVEVSPVRRGWRTAVGAPTATIIDDTKDAAQAAATIFAALGDPEELLVVTLTQSGESAPVILRLARRFPDDTPPVVFEDIDPADHARRRELLARELPRLLAAPRPIRAVVVEASVVDDEPLEIPWGAVAVGAASLTLGFAVGLAVGASAAYVVVVSTAEPAGVDPTLAARRHVVLGL